ncbi:MAG: ATP-grasp domain-containing protein [Cyanobacteria bacterium SZAS-4]|nr:ATP-grasp domain-containing protein [Cyanobacteria bacterium SZAS-4]
MESNADVEERTKFVQSLLTNVNIDLPPAIVIDVGTISGSGWAVVEANPAFGSEIYRCDPMPVLPVLARSIVSMQRITQSDRKWIIQREGDVSV